MATYIYTWNPGKWEWKNIKQAINSVAQSGQHQMKWSCGKNKGIEVGDNFLLVRLGKEPKGIVGYGDVTGEPCECPHWDEEKRRQDKKTLFTEVSFKGLSEQPLIGLDQLNQEFSRSTWTPWTGGVRVDEELSCKIMIYLKGLRSSG